MRKRRKSKPFKPNEYEIIENGLTAKIQLTQGQFAIIDIEDLELILRFRWCAVDTHGLWYARTSVVLYTGRYTMLMHALILNRAPPYDNFHTHHINGDGLDNRRKNLMVMTPKEHRQEH